MLQTSTLARQSAAALRMLAVMTLLVGVLYPAAVLGVGRLGLSHQADGSLLERNGAVVGSSLLGQNFTDPAHFQGRPSVSEYAGATSGASNLAPGSPDQLKAQRERQAAFAASNGGATAPADALTASASGLDPDISPANALAQVDRVARATGLSPSRLSELVHEHTTGRTLGFLGEERVNVLELNLALDSLTAH
jgi:K+-transporting ATPase ATPase C chain